MLAWLLLKAEKAVNDPLGRWRVTGPQVTASRSHQVSVARPERPRHDGKRRPRYWPEVPAVIAAWVIGSEQVLVRAEHKHPVPSCHRPPFAISRQGRCADLLSIYESALAVDCSCVTRHGPEALYDGGEAHRTLVGCPWPNAAAGPDVAAPSGEMGRLALETAHDQRAALGRLRQVAEGVETARDAGRRIVAKVSREDE